MRDKILSIGNSKPMGFLLGTVLAERYELIHVTDVFCGINELKANENIELILIDVEESKDENFDFIKHINSSMLYKKPVIALAASPETKGVGEAIMETVCKVIYKPFCPIELEKAIKGIYD